MKQVLAVRVGAKKAVGHIVSKRWWPTVWLAMHRHEVLVEAAGLSGRQNWALILSSSARVSRVTYETVIAVRYPELDAVTPTHVTFGNYLADRQATVGGFLPIFWRSPHNAIHATVDLGQMVVWISNQLHLEAGENGCLAVLHNRNALNSSEWVVNSEGQVISRGVTSCAGMTAQHVLLAQTKMGFLTGGRGNKFQQLNDIEKQSQREEAFARATVALTRAQRFCFIMCPLDMKGLIGAATVVGCLYSTWQGCVTSNLLAVPLSLHCKLEALQDLEGAMTSLRPFCTLQPQKQGSFLLLLLLRSITNLVQ